MLSGYLGWILGWHKLPSFHWSQQLYADLNLSGIWPYAILIQITLRINFGLQVSNIIFGSRSWSWVWQVLTIEVNYRQHTMKQSHEHLISANSRGCVVVNEAQWEITQPKCTREYLNYETNNKILSIQFSYQNKLRVLTKAHLPDYCLLTCNRLKNHWMFSALVHWNIWCYFAWKLDNKGVFVAVEVLISLE